MSSKKEFKPKSSNESMSNLSNILFNPATTEPKILNNNPSNESINHFGNSFNPSFNNESTNQSLDNKSSVEINREEFEKPSLVDVKKAIHEINELKTQVESLLTVDNSTDAPNNETSLQNIQDVVTNSTGFPEPAILNETTSSTPNNRSFVNTNFTIQQIPIGQNTLNTSVNFENTTLKYISRNIQNKSNPLFHANETTPKVTNRSFVKSIPNLHQHHGNRTINRNQLIYKKDETVVRNVSKLGNKMLLLPVDYSTVNQIYSVQIHKPIEIHFTIALS